MAYQQPCDDFHELDKEVATMKVKQAQSFASIQANTVRVISIEEEQNKMKILSAKQTAVYSAIGAAIPTVIMIIGMIIKNGGF